MCEGFTLKQKKECAGGDCCCPYRRGDTVPYYDKGSHKERSIANQPQHREHWKKVKSSQAQS